MGSRETFVQHFETFVREACPDLEIQEHVLRSRELFATAVTREARQKQLEKFFRAAFARVRWLIKLKRTLIKNHELTLAISFRDFFGAFL